MDSKQLASSVDHVPSNQNIYSSQTEERFSDHDISRDVINVSDEISVEEKERNEEVDLDDFELESALSSEENYRTEGTNPIEEETEMRRTVQRLFELEESLLDQHITNIKVSRRVNSFSVSHLFLDSPTYSFKSYRRMLKC